MGVGWLYRPIIVYAKGGQIMQNNIAKIRKRKKITQVELAKMVGITHWTISHIETGNRRPSTYLLERIADALNVPIKELFLGN